MKKMYRNLVILGAATTLFAFAGSAQAAVSGQCSDCHTMHNSQGGGDFPGVGPDAPYSSLLVNDCLGCHTTDANDPFPDPGGATTDAGYPYVAGGSFSDNNCLAGGFFTTTDFLQTDNNSNNEHSMGTTALPAGYNATPDWYTGDTNGFSCAGSNGCHGNHVDLNDMDAIAGGHHNTNSAYRILYVETDTKTGSAFTDSAVDGVPTADYEEALIVNTTYGTVSTGRAHNVYSANAVADNTISELCAICHGNFHGYNGTPNADKNKTTDDGLATGAWIRHPTDVVIPDDWIIGDETDYHPLTDSDNKGNPVGWDGAVEDTGERKATCISCHRAHGTANADLLRWAYSTQDAGSGVDYGCLGCHDKQR